MNHLYPNIDLKKTGIRVKQKIKQAGYSVKDIQYILNLSCPQPIYRWFKGQMLPSVDHLYVLSSILNVHMEELLAAKESSCVAGNLKNLCSREQRLMIYWQRLNDVA